MSPRTRQGILLGLLLVAIAVAVWAMEVPRWRMVTMPDGSSRIVVWPAQGPDGIYAAEIGRALVRADLEADDHAYAFAMPFDPARPISVDSRFDGPVRLSHDRSWDDFPVVASHPDHGAWVAWISFNGQQDELRLAPWVDPPGAFGAWNAVPTAHGRLWRPAAVVDAEGAVWVFWSQDEGGRFDLFGRRFDGEAWGPRVHIGRSAGADLDPEAVLGPDGTVHLVWQAMDGDSNILYAALRGGAWTNPIRLSPSNANDWEPDLAVASDGTVHVVWDTYDADDYDVLTRTIGPDGTPGPVTELAATASYEARATVTVDASDRVWYAWDLGPVSWAKDGGHHLPADGELWGTVIYGERRIEVRVKDGEQWLKPRRPLSDAVHEQLPSNDTPTGEPIFHGPELHADREGRVHLLYRQFRTIGFFSQFWTEYLTTMTDSGWSDPTCLPWSEGRISMTGSMAEGKDALWVAWPRDNYPTVSTWMDLPDEQLIENVYASRWRPDTPPGDDLVPYEPIEVTDEWDHAAELADVDRLRSARIQVGDQRYQVIRGDAHRHTELSSDIRGVPDGSALDLYRYFLDAAHLDWGVQTDHQGGGDRVYWWWLTTKLADLYSIPDAFVAMYGYERSIEWPHGHRNVVFAERGPSPVPIHTAGVTQVDYHGRFAWLRPHVFADEALESDTLLLFEELHRDDAVAIPHTTGSFMGTDWRYNDPEIDVVVEIYQGKRHSYEHVGAPLTDPEGLQYAPGMVHEAWKKGYRIGVIAASDHTSTHVSYGMLWVSDFSREGVMEALRARRTYGATDNILLDVRVGDHLMGERFEWSGPVALRVRVRGTDDIARIAVFRNEEIVYEVPATGRDADAVWEDDALDEPARYYVRVEQTDGNVAWSSPMWIAPSETEPEAP